MGTRCADRVQEAMESRLEDLRDFRNRLNSGDDDAIDDAMEEFSWYGLCFDYVEAGTFTDQDEPYFRWQISWGGPSDEFRFFLQNGDELQRVEYWFLDWFDGACREIDEEIVNDIWESFLLPSAQCLLDAHQI